MFDFPHFLPEQMLEWCKWIITKLKAKMHSDNHPQEFCDMSKHAAATVMADL